MLGDPIDTSVDTAPILTSAVGGGHGPIVAFALRHYRGRRATLSDPMPAMLPASNVRFVPDRPALDGVLAGAKQMPCPHCHRVGMLVGHGLTTGYAERGNDREIRGRRLLCSARLRRPGCGRTFPVLLATVIARFTVRTPTLSALLEAVVGGQSRKAAWEGIQKSKARAGGLCLRSGYRLWDRLLAAQSRIRTALYSLAPPPVTADPRPFAQMLAHLRRAIGRAHCVLAGFQIAFHTGVFT